MGIFRKSTIALLAAISAWGACAQNLSLDRAVYASEEMPFVSHLGPGAMANYLSQEIPFAPIAKLREQIETKLHVKLKHRGEAHITVITPVEYSESLGSRLNMATIERIALDRGLQGARFRAVAIGSGSVAGGKNGTMETFFVIVESEELLAIRRAIHAEFVRSGGAPADFDPEHFYPHVTIGFTDRDLHESDGVIKDVEHSLDERLPLTVR